MASQLELMAEAHRRGILPPDKAKLFEEAQRRGLVGEKKDEQNPLMRTGLRAQAYLTAGFDDEIYGAGRAVADTVGDIAAGRPLDVTKRYQEGRDYAREQKKKAFDTSDRTWLGYAGDTAADAAGMTGQAIASLPMLPQRAGTAAMTAGERLLFEFGKGTPQQVASANTAQALKPLTGGQVVKESTQIGGAFGGLNAYGEAEGSLTDQLATIGTGTLGGAVLGAAIPAGANAASKFVFDPIRNAANSFRSRQAAQSNRNAADFEAAGINPDEVFGPALIEGGPIDGTSTHLAGTIFGGPLREGARKSVQAIESRIADEVSAAGGRQSSAEAGENIQSMLRGSLTERSIPSDQIKRMNPAELQDVSGVAPGPKYDPPPPTVEPIPPRDIRPQTADDVLRAAEMEVQEPLSLLPPARSPQYPDEATPQYQTPKFDDIPEPPALVKERESLISMYDEAVKNHNALIKGEKQLQGEISAVQNTAGVEGSRMVGGSLRVRVGGREYKWNGRVLQPPRRPPRPDLVVDQSQATKPEQRGIFELMLGRKKTPERPSVDEPAIPEIQVSEQQAMALQRLHALQKITSERSNMIDGLSVQARNVRAAIDGVENKIEKARSQGLAERAKELRAAEDARVAEANANLEARKREADRIARELTEQDRRIAKEQADADLARRREDARRSVAKNADELAARRTEQLRREAEAEARKATSERQAQVEAEHKAELDRRRAQAEQEFELGKTSESFPTQLDAAYEQVARNAPSIQRNPLGQKNEPGRTRTAQLLDEFGQEARRNMKLRGYKEGQLFDNDGALRPDLLEFLDEHLGREVAGRIRAFSEARSRGSFVPSVQGLRDMRTAIGREMEAAKRARYQGVTRTADEAMLARLYDALSHDVQTFLRQAGPEGQLAARQMMQVDGEYKRFLRDLRMPLSKVFGDNVAPEQAIATLRRATRVRDGDTRLLERFYTVASARGDRLRATNSILQSMLDDGLATFLKEYRNISPEAREIMFAGGAKKFGEALDSLARAGGHLERYINLAGREPRLRQTIANPGNIMAVLSGFLHVPTAMLGIVGATSTSRVMASKSFNKWVRRAPNAMKKSNEWRRHVYRLRGILMAQGGMSKEAGNSLLQALVPADEPPPVKMPSVVPRHKTRRDVIERLQYEAN